jgi:hypothetical protein
MSAFQGNTLAPAQSHRNAISEFALEWPWMAAAAAYLLIFYVLPPPAPIEPGLDQSYFALLAELFLRGAQFGRDVIFTMGPWGFLQQPRGNPDIFAWALIGRSILALGTSVAAGSLAARHISSPAIRGGWLLVFLVFADPAFVLPFLLFAASIAQDDGKEDWRYLFLVPACGLAANIKFTALILVGSLTLLLLLDCVAFQRRFPWTPIGLVLSFLGFDLLAKQRLDVLADYLRTGASITSSYSSVFSIPGSFLDLAFGVLFCGVITLTWTAALLRAHQWKLLPLSSWTFVYFFLSFKYAFVRSDQYHLLGGIFDMAIPAALVLLILLPGFLRTSPASAGSSNRETAWSGLASPWRLAPALAIAGAILVFGRYLPETYRIPAAMERFRRIPLTFDAARRKEVYRAEIDQLRRRHPQARLDGTVSLFGYQLYVLPLWNRNILTLPLLQTMEAQNRELTSIDAKFLTGHNAPDHVLFSADTVDKHFPAMEDSLAWLSLLSHYEPLGLSGDFLDLRRAAEPVVIERDELLDSNLAFDQQLALPDEAPLWAQVEVNFNSLGRLAGLLLKLPAIKMIVDNGSAVRDYRVLPENAAAGFLLSPLVENADEFELMYRGQVRAGTQPRRISFRISPPGGQVLLRSGLKIRIYRLRVPTRLNSSLTPERRPG